MKKFLIFLTLAFLVVVSFVLLRGSFLRQPSASTPAPASTESAALPSEHEKSHGKDQTRSASRVPAFQTDSADLNALRPTLPPEKFTGKQKAAYQAVKEIPKTIAQLPCYCYCDLGHGHKSLHTCYEDEHAAHCAVCIDEALLAYRLEKEAKLTPVQIRERIIAQYSAQQ